MKTFFAITFILVSSCTLSQQSKTDTLSYSEIIRLEDYYQAEGVIFNKNYPIEFGTSNNKERFTPSLSDIRKAEEILSEKYNDLRGGSIDVKKTFRNYIRQYVGIIDMSGKKNIIVQLLGNNKRSKFKKIIGKSYQKKFIIIFDASWLKSQIFRINIDLGDISTSL